MKKQIGLMTLSLMLVTPAMAGGAGAPAANAKCKTITQVITGDKQLSTLATAIEAAGLNAPLSASGSLTVFAPNNAAFAKIPSDQLAAALNDPQALRNLLTYHVVAEKATAAQLRQVKGGTTMQGSDISIMLHGKTIMVNNANVIKADLVACNGIVHVIDTVLMPPAEAAAETEAAAPEAAAPATPAPAAAPIVIPALPLSGSTASATTTTVTAPATDTTATTDGTTATTDTTVTTDTTADTSTDATDASAEGNTVYDVLNTGDQYSTLVGLLSDAGLTEGLTSGEYTIFAPTNDAFDALPDGVLAAIQSDPEALKQMLNYHIVDHKVTGDQISSGADITTIQGSVLNLGSATVGQVVDAGNGVIYPIDAVLLPDGFAVPDVKAVAVDTSAESPNIATLVTMDSRFSILRGLLAKSGLADKLTSDQYTIFAPTDDAFNKFDQDKLKAITSDKDKLAAFLNALIVTGKTDAAALTTAPLKTLGGDDLTFSADGSNFKLGDASVSGDVVTTGNGNVYVLDGLVLPASLR